MITIERVLVQEVKKHIFPVIKQHWEEVDTRRGVFDLSPRWEMYEALEQARAHFSLAARDGDKYVAYTSSFIQPAMHCHNSTQLITESLFVLPQYRNRGVGEAILGATKNVGKAAGANYWLLNLKSFQKHDQLMSSLGLRHTEDVFSGAI